eukprot:CAMPEP_0177596018 /NCGR_PEP_ID=MMETSP0419_2-20121207/10746_1 /TAXON_ID=582737 /ORGANISM="Tetraselmis sp., Strain GSL018" /LENGTH=248 /DNA_ID=CAMNT_0019087677 /DNA_START=106 /DNA_END=852 /DNA_ORIENTATION=-
MTYEAFSSKIRSAANRIGNLFLGQKHEISASKSCLELRAQSDSAVRPSDTRRRSDVAQTSEDKVSKVLSESPFDPGQVAEDCCAICLSRLGELAVHTVDCGHQFHHCCISKWLQQRKEVNCCPLCRARLSAPDASETLWRKTQYRLATDKDAQEHLEDMKLIVRRIDEKNRNFGPRELVFEGVEVPYLVTGRVRLLMQSHESVYFIVFLYKDLVFEAHVDASRSIGYFMRLDVQLSPTVAFEISYVDH